MSTPLSRLRREALYAGAAAAAVSFLLGAGLPRSVGLWEDEAAHGQIALEWMRRGLAFAGSTRGLLMKDDYQGTLKAVLLWPSFRAFGASATVMRLTTLAWVAAGAGLLVAWAWRRHGRASGAFVAAAVAFDPYLILTGVFDTGPGALTFLLKAAAIFLLGTMTEGAAALAGAVAAGVLCGAAVWDKAHFLWVLGAAPLALLVWPRPARGPALSRRAACFLIGAAAGAAPILWYNLVHPLETVLSQARRADWPLHDAPRAWARLRLGQWAAAWSGREPYRVSGAELASLRRWLAALGALGAAALAARGAPVRARREGAAWLVLTAGAFALCAATPAPVKWHHFLALYPFPVLAAAAFLSGSARGLRRIAAGGALALAAAAAVLGVLDLRRFAADAAARGGRESFTRASVDAAAWAEARAAREPGMRLIAADHLEAVFDVQSGGRLALVDARAASLSPDRAAALASGRLIWVRRAPDAREGVPEPLLDSLEKEAGARTLAVFRSPAGAPVLSFFRARVADAAAAEKAWTRAVDGAKDAAGYDRAALWLAGAEAGSEAARELALKVVKESGDAAQVRPAAVLLAALGAPGESAAALERLAREKPADGGLQVELAQSEARLGRTTEALSAARRALALDRRAFTVRRAAAVLSALGADVEAAPLLEKLARAAPADALLQAELAQSYARLGRREEAARAARAALVPGAGADAGRGAAAALSALGDDAGAAAALERLTRESPKNAGLLADLARADARLGRKELGLRAARAAAALGGASARAGAASAFMALGAPAEAAKLLSRLVREFPADAGLQADLAQCEARLGHAGVALRAARQAAASTDPSIRRRAAGLLMTSGAPSEAAAVLEGLSKDAPGDAALKAELAHAYVALGRVDDARRAARAALAAGDPAVRRRAAILLQGAGAAPEAAEALERLSRAAPEDAALETDAAVAEFLAGRREEAVARLRRIVARHPELEAARRSLDAALAPAAR